jgi:glutamine amidotransferase
VTDREVVILDYGAGNLHSVAGAIVKIGYQPRVTSQPDEMETARAVILPGVGAGPEAMQHLRRLGLIEPVRRYIAAGRPFFGVCLGLQLLLTSTEEGGTHECLGVIPGRVKRLPPGLKTPHMGWNQVRQTGKHYLFDGIPDMANFYFVHSYYAAPDDPSVVLGETDYGVTLCSVAATENLVAVQFHPEKSGEAGLRMYDNFLKQARRAG